MSRVLFILPLSLGLSACGSTVGSGVAETEVRDVTGATSFDQRMWLPTTVRVGPAFEVAVTCDDNLLDEIITEVVDDVLVLREPLDAASVTTNVACDAVVELPAYVRVLNGGSGPMTLEGDFDSLPDLRATGSGPVTSTGSLVDLQEVLGSGSGPIDLAMVDTADLYVKNSGSSGLSIGDLQAGTVEVVNSASGSTALVGSATAADIEVSGSGGFGTKDFVVEQADLLLSGAGSAEITVTERVSVVLTGGGSATIFGDPEDRVVDDTGPGSVVFE
jgi:hypothetical protein